MRKSLWALTLALLLPAPTLGQTISVPETVKVDAPGLVVVRATAFDADATTWYVLTPGLQVFPPDIVPPKTGVFMGIAVKEGTYKVVAFAAKANKDGKAAIGPGHPVTVVVGTPTPEPPPGPGPGPGPTPASAPIAAPGNRVLIVYESGDALPEKQLQVLYGKKTREYLTSKCVAEDWGDAKQRPGWNIWDKDQDVRNAPKVWQDAMQRPRQSLPWIVISNGTTGYEGPLPATSDETIALCNKYLK